MIQSLISLHALQLACRSSHEYAVWGPSMLIHAAWSTWDLPLPKRQTCREIIVAEIVCTTSAIVDVVHELILMHQWAYGQSSMQQFQQLSGHVCLCQLDYCWVPTSPAIGLVTNTGFQMLCLHVPGIQLRHDADMTQTSTH